MMRQESLKAVIPVVNEKLFEDLLKSILANTEQPKEIIVIDNTPHGLNEDLYDTVTVFRAERRLGVNSSWRWGFDYCTDCDAVTVLNDDVILNPQFFARVLRVLFSGRTVSVTCPMTVSGVDKIPNFAFNVTTVTRMKKREGWAFTIRRDVLDRIPTLPDHILKTFFGDDWLWFWTVRKWGLPWLVDRNNYVYHYGSTTVNRENLLRAHKREKALYVKYVNDYCKRNGIP